MKQLKTKREVVLVAIILIFSVITHPVFSDENTIEGLRKKIISELSITEEKIRKDIEKLQVKINKNDLVVKRNSADLSNILEQVQRNQNMLSEMLKNVRYSKETLSSIRKYTEDIPADLRRIETCSCPTDAVESVGSSGVN